MWQRWKEGSRDVEDGMERKEEGKGRGSVLIVEEGEGRESYDRLSLVAALWILCVPIGKPRISSVSSVRIPAGVKRKYNSNCLFHQPHCTFESNWTCPACVDHGSITWIRLRYFSA